MSSGLAGIIVGESAISTVGIGLGLNYRGYDIIDLSKNCIFEEVAYLILFEKLPNQTELSEFQRNIAMQREIPGILKTLLEHMPKNCHPMDVQRTAVSFLGQIEPENGQNDQKMIAVRLLGMLPTTLLYWYHFVHNGKRISTSTGINDTVAENFLKMMHQTDKIDQEMKRAFDISLILYAEHDFNASTFASRVTVSTKSDFYSGICSAIGTLRGPLHGGANEAVMHYLGNLDSVEKSNKWLDEAFNKKELLMGFGHRVYKKQDPRNDIIKEQSRLLQHIKPFGNPIMYEISENIERRVITEKDKYPNLDFYSASAYHQSGIPTELFTPIFVCSRITGWSAHIFEQRKNNKLIRPNSKYVGPAKQNFLPMNQRPKL